MKLFIFSHDYKLPYLGGFAVAVDTTKEGAIEKIRKRYFKEIIERYRKRIEVEKKNVWDINSKYWKNFIESEDKLLNKLKNRFNKDIEICSVEEIDIDDEQCSSYYPY